MFMFMFIICHLHLLAMRNVEMDLSSFVSCFPVIEMLLFIAVTFTYGIYLSYVLVLFGIRIFNLFKYVGCMSLISLKSQQQVPPSHLCSFVLLFHAVCTCSVDQKHVM
ncbi:hypothetical protein BS78_03G180700 [Paspalum vaginatum]|nr:hypothetical protein BS78_03G180700 [Paspalum vaginatum]